jgi:hypothetical protein
MMVGLQGSPFKMKYAVNKDIKWAMQRKIGNLGGK